ncbi:MAG: hypothetical protein AAGK79_02985 [Pseudomonadota bacterium]
MEAISLALPLRVLKHCLPVVEVNITFLAQALAALVRSSLVQ